MLSKKNRVTKELFLYIMKNGGTLSGSVFVFRYLPADTYNFAVVAPKSVSKGAVGRNSLRRKGYTAIRSFTPRKGTGIFFYKKNTSKVSYQEIKNDIGVLLKKAKFI